jgi:hypothetical protein
MLGDASKTALLEEAPEYLEVAPGSSLTFADKVRISSVCRMAKHTENLTGDSSKTSLVAEARAPRKRYAFRPPSKLLCPYEYQHVLAQLRTCMERDGCLHNALCTPSTTQCNSQ